MPVSFWRSGLDSHPVRNGSRAMWLILSGAAGRSRRPEGLGLAPNARQRYPLSEETFATGTRELQRHLLVAATKEPQGAGQWFYNRYRNRYQLDVTAFFDELRSASPITNDVGWPRPSQCGGASAGGARRSGRIRSSALQLRGLNALAGGIYPGPTRRPRPRSCAFTARLTTGPLQSAPANIAGL